MKWPKSHYFIKSCLHLAGIWQKPVPFQVGFSPKGTCSYSEHERLGPVKPLEGSFSSPAGTIPLQPIFHWSIRGQMQRWYQEVNIFLVSSLPEINQINSLLLWLCVFSVVDHRRHQKVVRTSVTNLPSFCSTTFWYYLWSEKLHSNIESINLQCHHGYQEYHLIQVHHPHPKTNHNK